jgi:hypothetical protein
MVQEIVQVILDMLSGLGVGIAETAISVFTTIFLTVNATTGAVEGISPFAMWSLAGTALALVIGFVTSKLR